MRYAVQLWESWPNLPAVAAAEETERRNIGAKEQHQPTQNDENGPNQQNQDGDESAVEGQIFTVPYLRSIHGHPRAIERGKETTNHVYRRQGAWNRSSARGRAPM